MGSPGGSSGDSPGARLRAAIASAAPAQAMAAHNPVSALLAAEAGFDAIWASGFEYSASMGLADVSLVSMTQHLEMLRAMAGRTKLPIVADLDTGFGNAVNAGFAAAEYLRASAAALVIEDKTFPKVSSLTPGGRHDLAGVEEFQGKIEAACHARGTTQALVIARTEALIAGAGMPEALRRGRAYAEAGADLLLVHSKQTTPAEIEAFIAAWDGGIPLVLVPTAYPTMDVARMRATGKVGLAIWGNHALRAAVAAMQRVFARIRAEGGIAGVETEIATVEEIFRLQDMAGIRAAEARFLR